MANIDQTKIEPQPIRKHTGGARKGSQHALTHGLTTLKRAVNGLGNRLIDRRTATGKALAKWRADLIHDLGGDVSTQQSAIIDLAVKSKLLLDSIDVWLLTQPSLINMRKRSLLPVVVQRQQLADGLVRYLTTLGLNRTAKDADIAPWDKPKPDDNGTSAAPVSQGDTIRAEMGE
jgi:hypothetical protein